MHPVFHPDKLRLAFTKGICMNGYKELHGDLEELLKRQPSIYLRLGEGQFRTPDEVEKLMPGQVQDPPPLLRVDEEPEWEVEAIQSS
ncbi:hypothetical protein N7454_005785 [Penicillium verhagenii]|nr:hypothetical protein N7454_005785 [Penicillium verhagenii]